MNKHKARKVLNKLASMGFAYSDQINNAKDETNKAYYQGLFDGNKHAILCIINEYEIEGFDV